MQEKIDALTAQIAVNTDTVNKLIAALQAVPQPVDYSSALDALTAAVKAVDDAAAVILAPKTS
jgi:hypothetical protein